MRQLATMVAAFAVLTMGGVHAQTSPPQKNIASDKARPAPVAMSDGSNLVERAYWASIEGSHRVRDFEIYLNRYPNGAFTESARKRILALQHDFEEMFWKSVKTSKQMADFERHPNRFSRDQKDGRIVAFQPNDYMAPIPALPSNRVHKVIPANYVMLARRTAPVRSAPNISAKFVMRLTKGERLTVSGITDDGAWYAVMVKGHINGYVAAGFLEEPHEHAEQRMETQERRVSGSKTDISVNAPAPAGELAKSQPAGQIVSDLVSRGDDAYSAAKYAEAMSQYRQAADLGSSEANERIGYLYQNGQGVVTDYAKAMYWYRKAAKLGSAMAMNQIGVLYHQGKGVAINDQEAARWIRRAANLGNPIASGWIGYLYAKGRGVPKDCVVARTWLEKAAAAGDEHAEHWLGHNDDCAWK